MINKMSDQTDGIFPEPMSESHTTLVLGGARSGKSRYAESLAPGPGENRIYLATAQLFDDEMKARAAGHVERRGSDWKTIETPLALASAIEQNCYANTFVLVDCITLWLTNIILNEKDIAQESERLIKAVSESKGRLVLVSNEVGYGIVPENKLARRFRDEAGVLNQKLAQICDEVVLVAAGLPLTLKGNKG